MKAHRQRCEMARLAPQEVMASLHEWGLELVASQIGQKVQDHPMHCEE
jgi:hypothetical protein